MKTRKWQAALVAAALILGTTGTALADHNTNVPGAVYSDGHAKGFNKPHGKVQEDLRKAGVTDVSADHWAAGSISVLLESGLMTPDANGHVDPDRTQTVGEGVAIFAKVLGIASKTDDPATALKKAQEAGLVSGNVGADRDMSRSEVAHLIAKALGVKPKAVTSANDYPFRDFGAVSNEDAGILAALYDLGIFKGHEDGTFRPSEILTVSQIAALVDRILGAFAK